MTGVQTCALPIYNTRTGQLALTANGPNPEFSLSFSPDGKYTACGGHNEVVLYHLPGPAAKAKP